MQLESPRNPNRRAVPQALLYAGDRLTLGADGRARVEAIGHGARSEITGAEALAIAKAAAPGDFTIHDAADVSGLAPGAQVVVMADDYGRDPIAGVLVAVTPERIVIAREDADLGRLHVHFPRAGFILAASPTAGAS